MLRKLLYSGLAVIGLLAGPQKASADPAGPLSPQRPAGLGPLGVVLGGSSFLCVSGTVIAKGGSLAGSAGSFIPTVTFGSGITYAHGTTFVLQPGTYLVQLSVPDVRLSPSNPNDTEAVVDLDVVVNNNVIYLIHGRNGIFSGPPRSAYVTVTFNAFLEISARNSVVGFFVDFSASNPQPVLADGCNIVFTRLL
jgi:hypothetical protein